MSVDSRKYITQEPWETRGPLRQIHRLHIIRSHDTEKIDSVVTRVLRNYMTSRCSSKRYPTVHP